MILDHSNKLDLDVTNHFSLIKCFCNYSTQRLDAFTLGYFAGKRGLARRVHLD